MMPAAHFHVIPVGGAEPVHRCDASCWCHPTPDPDETNLIVHNARDCREARERFGCARPDEKWAIVEALAPQPP